MAKYKISHPYERKWVVLNNDKFEWGSYEQSFLFQNFFKAKAAYETMEPVRDCYNIPKKPFFMKIGD